MYNNVSLKDVPSHILIDLLRTMLLIRRFEEKIVDVYPEQNMKTPVHLCIGEEAIAAGVCSNLQKEDYLFTTHRSHGHCLAKGIDPKVLYAEFYGKRTGCCKGKGGSMHPASREYNVLGTSAIVGGGIPLAVGTALASKMRKERRVSVVFFGDGASEEGTFHESMNFASLKKLPVVFVCENNFYATNSPLSARQPHDNIAKRAEGYGMPGIQVDGNDVIAVYHAAREIIERARTGEGPTLLECRTYRWKGHVGPDCDYEKGCRPRQELEVWMGKCPVNMFKELLLKERIIATEILQEIAQNIEKRLDDALLFAQQSPFPETQELYDDVYFEKK